MFKMVGSIGGHFTFFDGGAFVPSKDEGRMESDL
jgi:hypothetical protein